MNWNHETKISTTHTKRAAEQYCLYSWSSTSVTMWRHWEESDLPVFFRLRTKPWHDVSHCTTTTISDLFFFYQAHKRTAFRGAKKEFNCSLYMGSFVKKLTINLKLENVSCRQFHFSFTQSAWRQCWGLQAATSQAHTQKKRKKRR